MSNHVDNGKQPMYTYQYVWVPHWPALVEKNQFSNLLGHHGNDPGTNQWPLQKSKEITSDISGTVKQCMEINAIDFGILKSDQEMSSGNQRTDGPELFESTMINISQESRPTSNTEYVSSLLPLAPPVAESSYMGSHIQHKKCPTELVTSHKILDRSLGFPAPLPENTSGASSCVSPQIFGLGEGKYGCGTIPTEPSILFKVEENDNHVRSIASSKRKLSDTNILKAREHEKCNDVSGVLSDNLSRRNNHPPAFREEQYKDMNNFPSINMLATCAHEADTMRIHSSAEDLGGLTPIYQVNHTFPVMENTDTNFRKKDENFRDSEVPIQVQENVPNKCFRTPQLIGYSKQGVEIMALSSDSEGNDDVNDVTAIEVVSKNASAETHTVDMKIIKEEHVSGVPSSSSRKNVSANMDSPHPDLAIGTPGKRVQSHKLPIPAIPDMNIPYIDSAHPDLAIGAPGERVQSHKHPIPGIQDINIPLHVETDGASVVDHADPRTSQTRSVDMDYVPDQSSRWLKCHKICDPCSRSVGRKRLRLDETTTNKKANQFVSRGTGGGSSNSEPVPVSTGKELMIVNKKKTPLKAAVSSSNHNVDGSGSKKRLRPWIQRWRKSPTATPKNRSEPAVICDPQTCEVSLEELEKKPFSSIAAMALLGKGWSDLKCQYRNEGTYTAWES